MKWTVILRYLIRMLNQQLYLRTIQYILAAIGAIIEKLDAVSSLELLSDDMFSGNDEELDDTIKMMN